MRPAVRQRERLWLLLAGALLASCNGTAGGEAFDFEASVAGPPDASEGGPLQFVTPRGYEVQLTKASLRVGAIYMNELLPSANEQADACLSPGRYTAQVTRGRDVDLLDRRLQRMPRRGLATSTTSRAAEVWLTGSGDVYDESDATPIFDFEGTAKRGGATFPFKGRFTIAESRKRPPPNPAQPGANPLCRERIVAPIPVDISLEPGGALELRVDPRKLFVVVDFAELAASPSDPTLFVFSDSARDAPSVAVFAALRSAQLYELRWRGKD